MVRKKKLIFLGFLLLIFSLSACSYFEGRGEDKKYFIGNEGVVVSFAPNTPPSQLYHRNGGQQPNFQVGVIAKNKGASLSKGGVYLSGYDPTVIQFEEIDENRQFFSNCRYSVDGIGYGRFDGYVQCGNIGLSILSQTQGGSIWDMIEDIMNGDITLVLHDIGGILDSILGTGFFSSIGLDLADLRYTTRSGGRLDVHFAATIFDPKLGARGPFFLSLWAPIKFNLNGGQEFMIPGDIPSYPGEDEQYFEYSGTLLGLPPGKDSSTQPLMLTTCYLYTTHAAPTVCIDPQPFSDNTKVCRPQTYQSNVGQGGPVGITSVTQKNNGDEIVFRIEVTNLGRGRVYDPGKIFSCSPYYPLPVTDNDVDVVRLGMVYLGDEMLKCTSIPDPYKIKLYDGKGVINCIYDLRDLRLVSKTAYQSPLLVELWYGYSETTRTNIEVRRLISS